MAALSPAAKAGAIGDAIRQFFSAIASPGSLSTHLRGAPLPDGPSAPCEAGFEKQYAAWIDRAIISRSPSARDPKVAAFMESVGSYIAGSTAACRSLSQLTAQERSFNIQSVNDPALLFFMGMVEPFLPARLADLDKAASLLPGTPYPKFFWFMVAANAGKTAADSKADDTQLKTRDDLSLKYLAQGLADDSFQPSEMSVLRWRFDANSVQDLFHREPDGVTSAFDASPKVAPWLKEYVHGVGGVEAAWKSRGADWENHVSDEGWRGFAQNLALARTHLVKSWQLNPNDPAPAAEMITVCMGESEETDTMRAWFDRSVAAQFDYYAAYKNLLWGLRPRWLGNFADLLAFGRECAATGRYDTGVPYELVRAAMAVSSDSEDPKSVFNDAGLDAELLKVLNSYFAQQSTYLEPGYCHTLAAILAHKLGRMDEVKQHLAAIHYVPATDRELGLLDDLPALVSQAQAASGTQ
jgi:hypothetical protein